MLSQLRLEPTVASGTVEVTVHIADLDEVKYALARAARLEEAVRAYIDAQREPAYSWVIESMDARREGRPNREMERMERVNAALAAVRAALEPQP